MMDGMDLRRVLRGAEDADEQISRGCADRSFDVITSASILCIGGSVVDGEPDLREMHCMHTLLQQHFMASGSLVDRLLRAALSEILYGEVAEVLDEACDVLLTHLTRSQRAQIYGILRKIIPADRQIAPAELEYLSYIGSRLQLCTPSHNARRSVHEPN
jgi:uncharacterized tellurite resistance protein B-like protein